MSHVLQTICDAPKCGKIKGEFNKWWTIRKDSCGFFIAAPISTADNQIGDQHFCSSTCMHAMLESWMQLHTDQPKPDNKPDEQTWDAKEN